MMVAVAPEHVPGVEKKLQVALSGNSAWSKSVSRIYCWSSQSAKASRVCKGDLPFHTVILCGIRHPLPEDINVAWSKLPAALSCNKKPQSWVNAIAKIFVGEKVVLLSV